MMYHNKVNPCRYGFLVGMIYIQPSASGQLPQDGVSIRSIQNAARNQLRQQCYAPKVLAKIERAIGVIAFHNVAYPKELRMCRKTKNNNCRPASLHKMVA